MVDACEGVLRYHDFLAIPAVGKPALVCSRSVGRIRLVVRFPSGIRMVQTIFPEQNHRDRGFDLSVLQRGQRRNPHRYKQPAGGMAGTGRLRLLFHRFRAYRLSAQGFPVIRERTMDSVGSGTWRPVLEKTVFPSFSGYRHHNNVFRDENPAEIVSDRFLRHRSGVSGLTVRGNDPSGQTGSHSYRKRIVSYHGDSFRFHMAFLVDIHTGSPRYFPVQGYRSDQMACFPVRRDDVADIGRHLPFSGKNGWQKTGDTRRQDIAVQHGAFGKIMKENRCFPNRNNRAVGSS